MGQTVVTVTSTSVPPSSRKYVNASYVDEPVLLIDRTAAGAVGAGTDERFYFHRNQQYSITALTDSSGTPVERYAYTAYGDPTILDGAGTTTRTTSFIGNPYLYTAQEYDAESALYHFNARMYEGRKGRFLSHDPIMYPDGANTYVGWFSVKKTDSLGLWIDGPPDDFIDAMNGRDRTKRCIFTMNDSHGGGQQRWDDDARRLLNRSGRGSTLLTGVTNPFVMAGVIRTSGCCEVTMIGHRGGLPNDGISTSTGPVFPNDALADAIGNALAANGCSSCSLRIFSCQLCKATKGECDYWKIDPNVLPKEDKEEQGVWTNVATRTNCTVTVPTHTLAIGATDGYRARNEGHTCVPGGCIVPTGDPTLTSDDSPLVPPVTRQFPWPAPQYLNHVV